MRGSKPLVSFVIPAFNAAQTIAESLHSIQACGVEDREVIVVDDGSTDATAAVAAEALAGENSRIFQLGDNAGLSSALNVGLTLAQGLYIARFDADDICLPERVSRQIEHLERNPQVAFCGTHMEFFGDREGVHHYPIPATHCNAMLPKYCCFGHPTVTFHRERVGNELYYNPGLASSEDYDLFARLFQHSHFGENLNFVGVRYRSSPDQFTKRKVDTFAATLLPVRAAILSHMLLYNEDMPHIVFSMLFQYRNLLDIRPEYREPLLEVIEAAKPKPTFAEAWRITKRHLIEIWDHHRREGRIEPISRTELTRAMVRGFGRVTRAPR